ATIDPNATQAFTATLEDQFGDLVVPQPTFGWTVSGGGSIDSSGLFTADGNGGGPFTVTATDPGSGVQGTTSVTIQNDAPTIAVAAAASPSPVTAGTTTDLSVLGADDGGEANLTYTWAVTAGPSGTTFSANGTNAAKNSTATFLLAGPYTFQVTVADQDGGPVTARVTGGAPFAVTATGAGAGLQGTASVTIQNDAPTIASAAAASPNPVTTGTTTDLGVLGADDGGETPLVYTWAATAGPSGATFSANGTNAAIGRASCRTKAGRYTVQVPVTDQDGVHETTQ